MRATLTDEQHMLRASAIDWLADHYDFRVRNASVHRDGGSTTVWSAFADLGWLGLPLPESAGGLGAGLLESCLLAQAMGRHLVVEPWLACVAEAARLLALTGDDTQRATWLPGVVAGKHRIVLADAEGMSTAEPLRTVARPCDGGWTLDGFKPAVVSAPGAARLLVSARVPDSGTALFIVDPQSAGIVHDAYDTVDDRRAADISFQSVRLTDDTWLGAHATCADAKTAIERVRAESQTITCWYVLGVMQAALDQTARHVLQRRQFGKPLAELQVVQHRIAEMAVLCAEAEAACELTAMHLSERDDASGIEAVAHIKTARAAHFVGKESVQLHGAMGVCEELPIAASFRVLSAFGQCTRDTAEHAAIHGSRLLASGAFAHSRTLYI
ncbi:acyl-CoA dehydrogenase [Comamonadaceae bacterium G21597-S1]|nr:acyl-CoA dehydrogenase [Comamonadaceae bacterium G21597-S1]